MLTYSQKKVFQMTKSTEELVFPGTLLFLQEISFSSTVFKIHDVDTELTFNLLTEKSFLLRTPRLVIYWENQNHIKKSQKCFLSFDQFILAKKSPILPAALRRSQVNLWHLAQPAICFNGSKGFSSVMCSKLELQDSSEKWQRKHLVTSYFCLCLHPQANQSSSITAPLHEWDSSDIQYQNLLKLKTEMKTHNIKPCCRTTQ